MAAPWKTAPCSTPGGASSCMWYQANPGSCILLLCHAHQLVCRLTHKAQQKATTLGAALSALILAGLVLALIFINCTLPFRCYSLLPDLLPLVKRVHVSRKSPMHVRCWGAQTPPCAWHAGHDSAGSGEKRLCTPPNADARIAFFGDLHGFTHPILTAVPKAQRLFDQAYQHMASVCCQWSCTLPDCLKTRRDPCTTHSRSPSAVSVRITGWEHVLRWAPINLWKLSLVLMKNFI